MPLVVQLREGRENDPMKEGGAARWTIAPLGPSPRTRCEALGLRRHQLGRLATSRGELVWDNTDVERSCLDRLNDSGWPNGLWMTKRSRAAVRVSTQVRGHRVVRLSELVSHRMDSTADLGRTQRRHHRRLSHGAVSRTRFCQISSVTHVRWSLATTLRVGWRVDSSKKS